VARMDGVLEVERGGMVSLASDVWSPSYMVLEVLTGPARRLRGRRAATPRGLKACHPATARRR